MTKNIKDKKASLLERATEGLDKPKPLSEEKAESVEQSKFISKKRAETVGYSEAESEKDDVEANIVSASGSDDETYTSSFRGLGNSKRTHSKAAHDQQEGVETLEVNEANSVLTSEGEGGKEAHSDGLVSDVSTLGAEEAMSGVIEGAEATPTEDQSNEGQSNEGQLDEDQAGKDQIGEAQVIETPFSAIGGDALMDKADTDVSNITEAKQQTGAEVQKTEDEADSLAADTAEDRPKGNVQEIDLVALREARFITPDMPPNLMSEEFRIIKRSILLNAFAKGNEEKKNSNIVLVTSSSPGEGKTFSSINLALSIATEQDVTVLLVDADFSKPEVLNRLGVAGGKGLMDAVADKDIDLGDCLVRTNIPNLVLLPAGRQHNLTTELLASDRMEKMVNELSTRYNDRIIIFDSPPVLASSAASVLALYMGQTVFVIEAEKTTEPQIKESLNMISACENINLVLNKTHYSGSNKKFASYYGYGGR
jgi:receptor protein-tyrosine kinase